MDRCLQQGGTLLPDLLHRRGTVEGVQWSVLCINVYNRPQQNMSCRKCLSSFLISDELTCDVSVNIKVNNKIYLWMYFSFFNIIAFLDEETQRLNLLERKIRRPRLASSDAEEISEDLDASHCIQTNTVTH